MRSQLPPVDDVTVVSRLQTSDSKFDDNPISCHSESDMGSSTLACHPAITPYSYLAPLWALSGQENKKARTKFLWGTKSGCDSELSPSQPYAQSADRLGIASLRRMLHQAVYSMPGGGVA